MLSSAIYAFRRDQQHIDFRQFGASVSASARPHKRRRADTQGNVEVAAALSDLASPLASAVWGLKDSLDDYLEHLSAERAQLLASTPLSIPNSASASASRTHSLTVASAPPVRPSRHRKADAIKLLLEAELTLSDSDKARLIHVFRRDAGAADTYLLISEEAGDGVRRRWVEQLLEGG